MRSPRAARLKLGMGVKADEVIQDFDQFTTRSINQNASVLSEFESKGSILNDIEGIFNEASGNGLTKTLQEFLERLAETLRVIPEGSLKGRLCSRMPKVCAINSIR